MAENIGRAESGLSDDPSFDWLKKMESADMEWMGLNNI